MVLVMAVAAGASTEIGRRGYSTDEEFTVFAVNGIREHAVPLLPSGLLYDRGLAYTYTSWLAGQAIGHELPVYRAVALLSAIAALVALGALVRAVSGGPAATIVTALVGASLPYWAAATTARFYAPFLLLYVLALRTLVLHIRASRHPRTWAPEHPRTWAPEHPRTLGTLIALSFFARLTHELALSLAAIPAAIFLYRLGRRRVHRLADLAPWISPTVAIVAGLAAAQALIVALHYLAPDSGETMIRRFFLWQLLNLFGSPLEAFDVFWHIARTWPLMTVSVIALALIRMLGFGRPWTGAQGFAHVLWIGWVIFFGVIDSGITINYLLVPVTLMLSAFAIDLAAVVPRRALPYLAVALAIGMAAEQWGKPSTARTRLDAVRPTITVPDEARLRRLASQAERVACTDELACLTLVGRVDAWLALDPFLLERFVVIRNGREEGVYAGSPVATRLSDLFTPIGDTIPERVLVVDVFKDLPIGPSSRFVPRALAEESVDAMTIIETPRLRVLELRLRSQLADGVAVEHQSRPKMGTGVISARRETRGES
jgi:hypothetical protein